MWCLDVPQENINVLQPSNFSVLLVTHCLEKKLVVVRLMNGEESRVRERKRVGFGGKKVGRELFLEQEKLTLISDSEDEIKRWVKSKLP